MKKIATIILIIIIAMYLGGCTHKTSLENGNIKVIISKDFGKEQLHDDEIPLNENTSVMEIMEENYEVETAYGGGFVNAVDGLKSGFTRNKDKRRKTDWFYYINGMLTQVGAKNYYLKPGDTIIWDYHNWSSNMYLSTIIGSYPSNFINGYEDNILNTQIKSTNAFKRESEHLSKFLKDNGLENVELADLDERELEDDNINSIVIGQFEELLQINYIKNIYKDGKRAGLFFEIQDNIKALDYQGNVSKEFKEGAVITSILKNYGSLGTLWIVTGNDDESIKNAIKILYETPEKIEGKFSVIVTEEVVNIPTDLKRPASNSQ